MKSPIAMRGFTLIELMVTLAVVTILATIGVPSFQDMIRSNQVAAQSNELIALMSYARNEAIRRGEDVRLELSPGTGASWAAEVYVTDEDDDREVLRRTRHTRTVLSDEITLNFTNRGYLEPFDNVTFNLQHEHCSSGRHRREYTLERTGRNQYNRDLPGCTDIGS